MPPPLSVRAPFVAEVAISRWFALVATSPWRTSRPTYRRPKRRIELCVNKPHTSRRFRPPARRRAAASSQRPGGVIVNAMTPHYELVLSPLITWPLDMTAFLNPKRLIA
jgi:hypothetical protein